MLSFTERLQQEIVELRRQLGENPPAQTAEEPEEAAEPEETTEPDENNPSGGNNIIQDANDIIWGTNHGGNNPTYNEEGGED